MPYLFGLMGLSASLLLLPLLPVLHVLRLERLAMPTGGTLGALTLNALLGSVVSNMLLARAMLLASPLVGSVGLSLSIPLAICSDVLRGRAVRFDAAPLVGTVAIWAGFFLVSAAEALEAHLGWRSVRLAGCTCVSSGATDADAHEKSDDEAGAG